MPSPNYKLAKRAGSPRWYIVWSESGRSRRVPTGTKDREQAELVLAAFRLERARPAQKRPDEVALSKVLDDYYARHASKLPSAETAAIAIRHLKAFYGAAMISGVTESSLDEYEAIRRPVSNETINRERMVLRAALNRARKRGWIRDVPHIPTLPKTPPKQRALSRKEAAKFLWACRRIPHLALFVRLGLYTGARRQAILDLTWERVDLGARLIHYPLPEVIHARKRRAVVPVAGALYTALERARRDAATDWVIEWEGAPVQAIKTAFRRAVARAGLENVTPHTLRHTAATWAAQSGASLWDVAGMLAQRVATTERVYAKHQPGYLAGAARAMLRGPRANGATMRETGKINK